MANDVCLSGGAKGADLLWGAIAEFFGMDIIHYSFKGHKRPPEQEQYVVVLDAEKLSKADDALKIANRTLKRKWPVASYNTASLLRRNFYQIVTSERLYAISTIKDGIVQGGTAWAVQMFIDTFGGAACEAYVFDQSQNQWFKWHTVWVPIKIPPRPHGRWTGIGTRDINKCGVKAAQTLFEQDKNLFENHTVNNTIMAQGSRMFKENDAVWIKSSELKGTISYMEEGYIEVVLDNGAEVSFFTFENLEAYSGQVAKPKKREQTWSELIQSRIDEAV